LASGSLFDQRFQHHGMVSLELLGRSQQRNSRCVGAIGQAIKGIDRTASLCKFRPVSGKFIWCTPRNRKGTSKRFRRGHELWLPSL
jgi:hypothetical protein